jgi:signal peptidase I
MSSEAGSGQDAASGGRGKGGSAPDAAGAGRPPKVSKARTKSPRGWAKEARLREKEARKLLRRGRRRLQRETRDAIGEALDKVHDARKARDADGTLAALDQLEPLVETHLARFRKSALREYSESIGLAVLFALMLRAFVVEAFQIPSESMVPTLLVGDHLFVNKFIYGLRIPFTRFDLIDFGDPHRGDVVVFIFPVEEVRTQVTLRNVMFRLQEARRLSPDRSYPASLADVDLDTTTDDWGNRLRYARSDDGDYQLVSAGPDGVFDTGDDLTNQNTALRPGQRPCLTAENLEEAKDYIKRVIGVAGDRIRISDGVLYVNDQAIPSRPLPADPTAAPDRFGREPTRDLERIGDEDYEVQYYGSMPDFDEITVRDGYIFVMGDNRDNSSDSRCWGQVPVENVKGKAMFIFWSGGSNGGFLGNRWNRMLHGIE